MTKAKSIMGQRTVTKSWKYLYITSVWWRHLAYALVPYLDEPGENHPSPHYAEAREDDGLGVIVEEDGGDVVEDVPTGVHGFGFLL